MPSEQQRAQVIIDFYVCEAPHQEKVKNPKLKGNVVVMFSASCKKRKTIQNHNK